MTSIEQPDFIKRFPLLDKERDNALIKAIYPFWLSEIKEAEERGYDKGYAECLEYLECSDDEEN